MPDASVNIGGSAAGAVAAVAEAQAAINSLHGRTIYNDVVTRGGDGAARVADDMGRAGDNAERAGKSARGMGDNLDRAGRSARGAADEAERAGEHMGRTADEAERLRGHMAAVDSIMRGGAPSSTERASSALRGMAADAILARGAIGELGGGSGGMRAIESGVSGAGRSFRELGQGAASASRFIVDSGGGAQRLASGFNHAALSGGRFMAGVSGGAQQVSRDLVPMERGADGAYRAVSRLGGSGKEVEKLASSFKGIDAVGRILGDVAGGGSGGGGGGILGALGGEEFLGAAGGAVGTITGAVKGLGMASAYSAVGMGALGAAVAGVGAGAVLEDVLHSAPLMHAAEQGVRGFNGALRSMSSEATAAGLGPMNTLSTAVKGVGHELGVLGVQNIGAALGDASKLAGSATTAMQKLAPAIQPAMTAATSLGQAVLGAFGDSGGEIAHFANVVTQSSDGIQSALTGTVRAATALGGGLVQAVAAAAPLINAGADVVSSATDFGLGSMGVKSNYRATPNPDGSTPAPSWGNTLGGIVAMAAGGPLGGLVMGGSGATQSAVSSFRGGGSAPDPFPTPTGGPGGGPSPGWHPPPLQSYEPGGQRSMPGGFDAGSGTPGRLGDMGAGRTPAAPPDTRGGILTRDQTANDPKAQAQYEQMHRDAQGPGAPGISMGGQRVGSSAGIPSPAAAQQLSQAMQGVQRSTEGATSAQRSFGSTAPGSLNQVSTAAQGAGAGVQQQMQGMTRSVASAQPAVHAAAAQIPQAIQQGATAAPPSMVAPVAGAVHTAVQAAAPVAESGGASLGASVGGGMGQGVTKTETSTLTIVRKWVEKIIDEGASALGARSPSKKFEALGASIPAGMTAGVQANQGSAVTATQQMMQRVVQGAQSELGGVQAQLGSGLSQALGGQGSGGSGLDNRHQAAIDRSLGVARQGDPYRDSTAGALKYADAANQAGDATGQAGDASNKTSDAAKRHAAVAQWASDQQAGIAHSIDERAKKKPGDITAQDRADSYGQQGLSVEAEANIARHNDRFNVLDEARKQRHQDAADRSLGLGPSPDYAGQAKQDAQAQQDAQQQAAQPPPKPADPLWQADVSQRTGSGLGIPNQAAAQQLSKTYSQGQQIGAAGPQGVAAGIQANQASPVDQMAQMATQMTDAVKKKLGIQSPSTVMAQVGANSAAGLGQGTMAGAAAGVLAGTGQVADAVSSAMTTASARAVGPVSNAGLMVGYAYATNIVTGATQVLKAANFQGSGTPNILAGEQAQTALGQIGLLGPGAGASVYKTPSVAMDGAGQAAQMAALKAAIQSRPIHLTVNLDSQPFKRMIVASQDDFVEALRDASIGANG